MFSRSTVFRLGLIAGTSVAIAAPAHANPNHGAPAAGTMAQSQYASAPLEYGAAPAHQADYAYEHAYDNSEQTIGADGVETVTYTHYSTATGHTGSHHSGYTPHTAAPHSYYPTGGTYPGAVFDREQWLTECRRRTDHINDDNQKGGIIGGLLGAITGGIIGNRVADSERLGGTLIGAGVGGLAGAVIGALIQGRGRDRDRGYDCEAALDNYLSQYGHSDGRFRTIPAGGATHGYSHGYTHSGNAHSGAAHYGSYGHYGYAGGYYPGCGCQPQITYIPIHYQQRQRVVVRETVTEEIIPGKVRHIPGKYIKQTHKVVVPVKHTKTVPAKMVKHR